MDIPPEGLRAETTEHPVQQLMRHLKGEFWRVDITSPGELPNLILTLEREVRKLCEQTEAPCPGCDELRELRATVANLRALDQVHAQRDITLGVHKERAYEKQIMCLRSEKDMLLHMFQNETVKAHSLQVQVICLEAELKEEYGS